MHTDLRTYIRTHIDNNSTIIAFNQIFQVMVHLPGQAIGSIQFPLCNTNLSGQKHPSTQPA